MTNSAKPKWIDRIDPRDFYPDKNEDIRVYVVTEVELLNYNDVPRGSKGVTLGIVEDGNGHHLADPDADVLICGISGVTTYNKRLTHLCWWKDQFWRQCYPQRLFLSTGSTRHGGPKQMTLRRQIAHEPSYPND